MILTGLTRIFSLSVRRSDFATELSNARDKVNVTCGSGQVFVQVHTTKQVVPVQNTSRLHEGIKPEQSSLYQRVSKIRFDDITTDNIRLSSATVTVGLIVILNARLPAIESKLLASRRKMR